MALGQAYEQNLAWDPFSELRTYYKKLEIKLCRHLE